MKIISYKYTLNYIQLLILVLCVLTILKVQAEELINLHEAHSLDGSHGMVLIHDDKEGFFVSHLPLYSRPHHFQLIYKVRINESDKVIDLLENGMITVLPDNFDLSRLVKGESFSINATFYQGHFERGGEIKLTTNLLFDEPVLIKRVNPKFNAISSIIYTVPISNQLEIFAHKIQQAPSFDAIGFINSAEIKRYNNQKEDGVKYLTCDKGTKLTTQKIKQNFEACQKFNIQYIETKDFS
jgi:hypothetical protein